MKERAPEESERERVQVRNEILWFKKGWQLRQLRQGQRQLTRTAVKIPKHATHTKSLLYSKLLMKGILRKMQLID